MKSEQSSGEHRVGFRTMRKMRWPLMIVVRLLSQIIMSFFHRLRVTLPISRAGPLRDCPHDGRRNLNPSGLAHFVRSYLPLALYSFTDLECLSLLLLSSAVGGLAVPKPEVTKDVVAISLSFLAFIFLIQRWGANKISMFYAPVTVIWLLLLGSTGIVNIVSHPGIFRAFDPSRAVMFFVRTGNYDALAGILLCVTGCEGLFSNLGSFNPVSRPSRLLWFERQADE